MASVSEKNGNSVSGGKPERGGLTGSGTGLEPKPIRVSVIDDDPMICQAMSLILNDYSHGRIEVVSTSTDGETCVRRAAEEKPDVVLMDIAMPGVDGIEATRLLRSLSPAPHVLILTSLSPSGTVERAVEAGAEGFVSKTDAADDIIRRIIGVCEGAPQFNTASQKQLIDDLSVTRPRSRRDEGARPARRAARPRARGRDAGGRGLYERRNRLPHVHFGAYGEGASFFRGEQARHGPRADGAAGGAGRSAGAAVSRPVVEPYQS